MNAATANENVFIITVSGKQAWLFSAADLMMPSKCKLIYDKKLFVEAKTIDYKLDATVNPQHFEQPR